MNDTKTDFRELMKQHTCVSCWHWSEMVLEKTKTKYDEIVLNSARAGECRVRCRDVMVIGVQQSVGGQQPVMQSFWPIRRGDEFCGEHPERMAVLAASLAEVGALAYRRATDTPKYDPKSGEFSRAPRLGEVLHLSVCQGDRQGANAGKPHEWIDELICEDSSVTCTVCKFCSVPKP